MSKLLIQKHKVEFWECDISGYVHNSKYFIWFERARFEIAKEVGLNDIEGINGEDGFYFPVLEAECKFINTIYMDTDLVIKTELEKPIAAKLKFKHTIEEEKTGNIIKEDNLEKTQEIKKIDKVLRVRKKVVILPPR